MKSSSRIRLRISYFSPAGALLAQGYSVPFSTHNNGKERLPAVEPQVANSAPARTLWNSTATPTSTSTSYLGKRSAADITSIPVVAAVTPSPSPSPVLLSATGQQSKKLKRSATPFSSSFSLSTSFNAAKPALAAHGGYTFVYEKVYESPPDSPAHQTTSISSSGSSFMDSTIPCDFDLSWLAGDDRYDQAAFDIIAASAQQMGSSLAPSMTSSGDNDDVVFPLLLQTVDYLESLLV